MSNDATSQNNAAELRSILFAALRGLADKSMDIDHAKATADLSQVVINSAKVEVEFLKVAGGNGSGFFPTSPALPKPKPGTTVSEPAPGVRVTRHVLPG